MRPAHKGSTTKHTGRLVEVPQTSNAARGFDRPVTRTGCGKRNKTSMKKHVVTANAIRVLARVMMRGAAYRLPRGAWLWVGDRLSASLRFDKRKEEVDDEEGRERKKGETLITPPETVA